MRRSHVAFVMALALASVVLAAPEARASAESEFVSRINAERSARGLRTLRVKGDLAAVAEQHSARMARQGRIYHNPSLRSQVSGWTVIGENVGRGSSVRAIHRAFMSSSSHRGVILNPKYNQIGVGVTKRGSTLYVSQVFVRRRASSTTTAQRTSSEPRGTRTTRVTRASRSRPRAAAPVALVRPPAPRRVVVARPQTVELLVRMMRQDADL